MEKNGQYINKISLKNKAGRFVWNCLYPIVFRPFSLPLFWRYRNFVLRLFGAKIGKYAGVHASVRIWAPWNLELKDYACLDDRVNVYNVDKVILHEHATVSFEALLCTASHNIYTHDHELITAPIVLQKNVWVGAAAYVGMGVTIGEGAVVAAASAVHKSLDPWSIVGGNPAKFIKKRNIQ